MNSRLVSGFYSLFQGVGSLAVAFVTDDARAASPREQCPRCPPQPAGTAGHQHNSSGKRPFVEIEVKWVCQVLSLQTLGQVSINGRVRIKSPFARPPKPRAAQWSHDSRCYNLTGKKYT